MDGRQILMHAASPSFILAIWAQGRLLAMLVAQAVGHGRRRLIQKQPPWLAALGVENVTQKTRVYLLTYPHRSMIKIVLGQGLARLWVKWLRLPQRPRSSVAVRFVVWISIALAVSMPPPNL